MRYILTMLVFAFSLVAYGQSMTGTYRLGDPDIAESAHGILEIRQTSDKELIFKLVFTDHAKSNELSGTAIIGANGEAKFAKLPCAISLKATSHEILLLQEGDQKACGLPADADISGTYQKISMTSKL